LPPVLKQDVLV